ncbi:hypothetical protein Poly24_06240 [Rosistilla carotiformis]|uniref:Uncharacterized protein n=1 Tax=Rosistilla carotiformis TaxID=2528017 RepID=A0A518JN01_9BACT|nr:hypothetical protein Poly24_06240 [Rosistilla carotiformis]
MAEEKLRGGFERWGVWGWFGGWAVPGAPLARSRGASDRELFVSPLPLRSKAIGQAPPNGLAASYRIKKNAKVFASITIGIVWPDSSRMLANVLEKSSSAMR